MGFLKSIQAKQYLMTNAELVVSQHILENPEAVAEFSIAEFATKFKVSRNAISRFCQKMAFKGYGDFRYEFTKWLHTVEYQPHLEQLSLQEKIIQIANDTISKISSTMDEDLLRLLAKKLNSSQQVKIIATGKSIYAAYQLKNRFQALEKFVTVIDNINLFGNLEYLFAPDDLIIVFSVSGKSIHTNKIYAAAREKSKNIFLFTSNKNPQIVPDYLLLLPTFSKEQSSFVMDNQSLFFIAIDILINYYLVNLDK